MIEGQSVRIKSKHLDTEDWVNPEMPEHIHSAMEQWVQAVNEGKQPCITKEDIVNLTAINEAAAISNKEGRRVLLSEIGVKQGI